MVNSIHETLVLEMPNGASKALWSTFSEKILLIETGDYAVKRSHIDRLILNDPSSEELARAILSKGSNYNVVFYEIHDCWMHPGFAITKLTTDLYKSGKNPEIVLSRNSEFISIVAKGPEDSIITVYMLGLF